MVADTSDPALTESFQEQIMARMKRSITDLILDQPFFGSLALRLDVSADETTDTAYTDGTVLRYSSRYLAGLTEPESIGLVCHEILHCALGHPWRRAGREPRRWNMACDYAVNEVVVSAGFTLPAGALLDDRFNGMSAEAIYSALPEASGCGLVCGLRDAPSWDAVEKAAEWEIHTLQAARSALQAGKLPSSLRPIIQEIGHPRVDWKAVLRRFVQETARNDYSWRMPNPRYTPHGLYLPSLRSESMPPLVVAIDTSGSIDERLLAAFAAEVQSIFDEAKPEALHVVYFDDAVRCAATFTPGDIVELHPFGGGGTDFVPIFGWLEREEVEPAALIVLTDLQGNFPERPPHYPTLWATTESGDPPFGETVELALA